jgi:hypothetical protein
MAEWLILLLVVPAIVVPVVMLVGFAGCQVLFPVDDYRNGQEQEFGDPIIDSAFGKSVNIITLKWKYDNPATAKFEFERTKLPDDGHPPPTFLVPVPTTFEFDDIGDDIGGLEAETSYLYRVRAKNNIDEAISTWSDKVAGTTLSFQETFNAESQPESQLTLDEGGWEGNCLVQRIEPARLMLSGTPVRLTLRASSLSDAYIDRIYISQSNPAATDHYQPAGDLKEVATAIVVPNNGTTTLDPVDYALDKGWPLLIAVDFTPADPNAGPFSGIRYAPAVPLSEAVAFYRQGAEAAQSPRSADYTQVNRIYLIEKIEVG